MKFCSLDEAFRGNTYIPGDQPNEKPYGPFTPSEPENQYTTCNQEIPVVEPQVPMVDHQIDCSVAFNNCNNCPICKKHILDLIEIEVRERILIEARNQPNNNILIIIIIIILAWMLLK